MLTREKAQEIKKKEKMNDLQRKLDRLDRGIMLRLCGCGRITINSIALNNDLFSFLVMKGNKHFVEIDARKPPRLWYRGIQIERKKRGPNGNER